MAKKPVSKKEAPATSKRRITKPGGFNIPGYGDVKEGDEVTNEMRKAHDAWTDGQINIDSYTS